MHKKDLAKTSKAVDREYVARFPGQNGLRMRDTKLTDLYNYFALPPVRAEYCDTALRKVTEVNMTPVATFGDYAVNGLTEIDGIFMRFFDAYAQYQRDLADWNMKYAPPPPIMAQPAMVPGAGSAIGNQPPGASGQSSLTPPSLQSACDAGQALGSTC